MWIFRLSKIDRKKYVEKTWIFQPAKLHQEKYVEATRSFRQGKLYRKRYVETTLVFRSPKLRGNDVEIRRNLVFDVSTYINVELTSIQRGVPVGF